MTTEVELTEERKKELLAKFDQAALKLRTDPNNFQSGGYYLLLKKERNRPVVLLVKLSLDCNFLHWGGLTVKKEKLPKKMTLHDMEKNGWKHLSRETAGADEKYVRRAFYYDHTSYYHATLPETCYFRSREDFFRSMAKCLRVVMDLYERTPVGIGKLFRP